MDHEYNCIVDFKLIEFFVNGYLTTRTKADSIFMSLESTRLVLFTKSDIRYFILNNHFKLSMQRHLKSSLPILLSGNIILLFNDYPRVDLQIVHTIS